MAIRSWVNPWTTPGQSESTRGTLDRRISRDLFIGRDLVVGRDVDVERNLNVDGTISGRYLVPWQSYTPNVYGYQTPAGGGTLATNMHFTVTGTYARIDTLVFFQVTINMTGPTTGLTWNSNLYVDLPTKTAIRFAVQAIWRPGVTPTDATYYPLFAVGKPGTNQLVIVPDANVSGAAPVLMSGMFQLLPYEVTVSHVYEFQA